MANVTETAIRNGGTAEQRNGGMAEIRMTLCHLKMIVQHPGEAIGVKDRLCGICRFAFDSLASAELVGNMSSGIARLGRRLFDKKDRQSNHPSESYYKRVESHLQSFIQDMQERHVVRSCAGAVARDRELKGNIAQTSSINQGCADHGTKTALRQESTSPLQSRIANHAPLRSSIAAKRISGTLY